MIRIILALAVLCATARADTVYELTKTKVRLELPDSWQKVDAPALVASYKHPAGSVLAVTRADVPNGDAWKNDAKVKQAYADQVERGIRAGIAGYMRSQAPALPGRAAAPKAVRSRSPKKLGKASGVPVLDVEASREGGATVLVRVLMFRTFALSLAIEVPNKGDIAVARAIAAKFSPPKETP